MRAVETASERPGREDRFTRLAGQVYEPLQRFAARRVDPADVDDVVSESLVVLWRRLDEVPADAALPWAYAVARNVIANQRRSSARRAQLTLRLAAQPEHPVPGPEDAVLDPALEDALEAALDRLGATDREIVLLWAWEDLAPREIAVVLGSSANAVSLRLSRARRRLRAELGRAPSRRQDRGDAGQTTDASEGGRR